ncbi:hypothetical protein CICLE_v10034003mg [Citrus x clementina]|uniref:Uncharacterized protein n=1 Tax=Citrus clementina TaxID=85681 RepID=V4TFE3_CITCL|nr:hypothetical protein CICLE_v10034003mg [Citrus x clementina]
MRIHSSLFRNLLKKLAGRIEPTTFIATTELLITSYMSTCIHNIFDCIDGGFLCIFMIVSVSSIVICFVITLIIEIGIA